MAAGTGFNSSGGICGHCGGDGSCGRCKGSPRPSQTPGPAASSLSQAMQADTAVAVADVAPARVLHTQQVVVHESELGRLQSLVDKRNEKARLVGYGGYELTVTGRHSRAVAIQGGSVPAAFVDVEIRMTPVQVPGGGQIVCVLQDGGDADNIIHGDPPEDVAQEAATVDFRRCDRCGRRQLRTRLLVIQTNAGNTLYVGGECAKAFVGDGGIDSLIAALGDMPVADGFNTDYEQVSAIPTTDLLAAAVAVTEAHSDGEWVSVDRGRHERIEPTGQTLRRQILDPRLTVTEEHIAQGETIRSYLAELNKKKPVTDLGSYMGKVNACLDQDLVAPANISLTGSAVAAYANAQIYAAEETKREALKAAKAVSVHQGEKGDTLSRMVEVTDVRHTGGQWPSTLIKMVDEDGNLYATFNSGAFARNVGEGDSWEVRGKVKDHTEYEGAKETLLSNTKTVSDPITDRIHADPPTPQGVTDIIKGGNRQEIVAVLNLDAADRNVTVAQVDDLMDSPDWNIQRLAQDVWFDMPVDARRAHRDNL